jgi:hypothetical protein
MMFLAEPAIQNLIQSNQVRGASSSDNVKILWRVHQKQMAHMKPATYAMPRSKTTEED